MDAVRLVELGGGGGAAVSGVAGFAGADDRGDEAGGEDDFADGVILHVHDIEVASAVETDLVREIQGRGEGGAAIAGVSGLAITGDGADGAGGGNRADALAAVFAEPEIAVGAADNAEGVVDLRGGGGTGVAGETFDSGAGDGAEGRGRQRSESGEEDSREDEEWAWVVHEEGGERSTFNAERLRRGRKGPGGLSVERSALSVCQGWVGDGALLYFHSSLKKPASTILPGQRGPGGVRRSTTAQSGSLGVWRALLV